MSGVHRCRGLEVFTVPIVNSPRFGERTSATEDRTLRHDGRVSALIGYRIASVCQPCWTRLLALIIVTLVIALPWRAAVGAEPKIAVTVGKSGEAFIVDAAVDVPVSTRIVWEVMTDFDHMVAVLDNLKSSRVTSRNGNTWIVRQEGVARYGLLSFTFASEREMRLEPMTSILARQISGTARSMTSEAKIIAANEGARIEYHAETVIDSSLARMFGGPFLRHEVEEQFTGMGREMLRRQANGEAVRASRE